MTSTITINQLIVNLAFGEKSGRSFVLTIRLADFLRCGKGRPPGPVRHDSSAVVGSLYVLYIVLEINATRKTISSTHGYTVFVTAMILLASSFVNRGSFSISVVNILLVVTTMQYVACSFVWRSSGAEGLQESVHAATERAVRLIALFPGLCK